MQKNFFFIIILSAASICSSVLLLLAQQNITNGIKLPVTNTNTNIDVNVIADTSNWQIYQNKELGIEFMYPKEWGEVNIKTVLPDDMWGRSETDGSDVIICKAEGSGTIISFSAISTPKLETYTTNYNDCDPLGPSYYLPKDKNIPSCEEFLNGKDARYDSFINCKNILRNEQWFITFYIQHGYNNELPQLYSLNKKVLTSMPSDSNYNYLEASLHLSSLDVSSFEQTQEEITKRKEDNPNSAASLDTILNELQIKNVNRANIIKQQILSNNFDEETLKQIEEFDKFISTIKFIEPEKTGDWQTYRSINNIYEINYPNTWQIETVGEYGEVVKLKIDSSDASIQIYNPPTEGGYEAWEQTQEKNTITTNDGIILNKVYLETIDPDNVPYDIILTGWGGESWEKSVQIKFWYPYNNRFDFEKQLDEVLKTFRLIEKDRMLLQEITNNGKTYKAYLDKIVEVINNEEIILYELEPVLTRYGDNVHYVGDYPNLTLSPSGYILFFDYFKGDSSCLKNGIQLDSKQLLWNDKIGCGADTFWSPDNKQVVFVWNLFDNLTMSVSKYGDIKILNSLIESVYYPSENENTKFYWKSNDTFVFEPNSDYMKWVSDEFDKAGLDKKINEFKVR